MDFAVVRLSSFGDIILTEPVTRALRAGYQDSRIYFITRSDFAGVPELFEAVDEVIPYSREGANDDISRLSRALEFEAVIDLQNNIRSRRLCGKLRKRRLARYGRPVLKRFLLVRMPWLYKRDLRHTIDLYGDALGRLGIEMEDRVPRVPTGAEARERAARLLAPGAQAGPLVALCPGGSSEIKRWPEASFAGLAEALTAAGLRVLVLGSEEDRRQVELVAAHARVAEPTVVVSRDVTELAALLSLAAVTVTNDSGLMHLAAAAGSRIVAVFGPTSPALGFAPLGEGHVVAGLDLGCSPCSYHGNRPCRLKRRVCMEDLTAAEVMGGVKSALGEAAGHA
jgi:heptosyltransferase-2